MPSKYKDYVVTRDDADTGEDVDDETLVNFCVFSYCDLVLFEEAAADEKWIESMHNEIHSIEKNKTRELTDLPAGMKPILE